MKDINNERYALAIAAQTISQIPTANMFNGYPDIASPFRERDTIERIVKRRAGDVIAVLVDPKCDVSAHGK